MSYLTYTYSRKVGCPDCGDGENCNILPKPKLYVKNRSSSLMSSLLGSKHVYASAKSHIGLESIKGKGNTVKHGSGGNSYANYLAKKKGIISCNCDVEK